MRLAGNLVFSALFVPMATVAGVILDAAVIQRNGVYDASVDVMINAPMETVIQLITDYDNLAAINPSIEESRVLLAYGPDKHRVHSVIRVCILIFCKQVLQVQDVERLDNTTIEAVTLPADSDFISSVARWRFTEMGQATTMHFTQQFEPDFWVPAVVGPWLVKRTLVHEVSQTAIAIERMARKERAK